MNAPDRDVAVAEDRPIGCDPAAGIGYETGIEWIPTVSSGYHSGVDGLSLPLPAMTSGLFLACAIFPLRETERVRWRSSQSAPGARWTPAPDEPAEPTKRRRVS